MADSFRENLRNELDYQDMTVKELCAKTGIPKATLECYLGARANMPSAEAAVKIARTLGVSVEYLITGEDVSVAARFLNAKSRELQQIAASLDDAGHDILLAVAKTLQKHNPRKNQ